MNNLQTPSEIASHFNAVIPHPETLPASFSELGIPILPIPTHKLGIQENLVQMLESKKITKPTIIQSMVIPQILAGSDVLCASNTGFFVLINEINSQALGKHFRFYFQ